MRGYFLIHKPNGYPDLDDGGEQLLFKGYVLGAMAGAWGLYLVMGTSAQLAAIHAHANTVGICTLGGLDETVTGAVKSALDAWADAHFPSLPPVPADWTNRQVIQELGERVDENFTIPGTDIQQGGLHPDAEFRVLALAPQKVGDFPIAVRGDAWKLIDIGAHAALWEIWSDELNLMQIHTVLYETMVPADSWGLLGVVLVYGSTFYDSAVMDAFDHPAAELLARRDRIADYMEAQGYTSTGILRGATTEHRQIVGIVSALGYTMPQLWGAMHG